MQSDIRCVGGRAKRVISIVRHAPSVQPISDISRESGQARPAAPIQHDR